MGGGASTVAEPEGGWKSVAQARRLGASDSQIHDFIGQLEMSKVLASKCDKNDLVRIFATQRERHLAEAEEIFNHGETTNSVVGAAPLKLGKIVSSMDMHKDIKIALINESIKQLKKNYYDLRSKKVQKLISSVSEKSFKKSTLGGCIFFKKNQDLCLKIEKL